MLTIPPSWKTSLLETPTPACFVPSEAQAGSTEVCSSLVPESLLPGEVVVSSPQAVALACQLGGTLSMWAGVWAPAGCVLAQGVDGRCVLTYL